MVILYINIDYKHSFKALHNMTIHNNKLFVDICSDTHADCQQMCKEKSLNRNEWQKWKNNGSNILLIAGDISNNVNYTLRYLEHISKNYDRVLYVDGNHEHYSNVIIKQRYNNQTHIIEEQKKVVSSINIDETTMIEYQSEKVHYLGKEPFIIDDTAFIGVNGWYNFSAGIGTEKKQINTWNLYSNDSVYINFNTLTPKEYAIRDSERLAAWVKSYQNDDNIKNIVILTHTIPTMKGITQKPHDLVWSSINGAYANLTMNKVVEADINKKIKLWVFGHTHYRHDFLENNIRYICFPRGYNNKDDMKTIWNGPLQINVNEQHVISAFGEIE